MNLLIYESVRWTMIVADLLLYITLSGSRLIRHIESWQLVWCKLERAHDAVVLFLIRSMIILNLKFLYNKKCRNVLYSFYLATLLSQHVSFKW